MRSARPFLGAIAIALALLLAPLAASPTRADSPDLVARVAPPQQEPAPGPFEDEPPEPEERGAIESEGWASVAVLVLIVAGGAFLLSLYAAKRLRVRHGRRVPPPAP